MKRKLAVRYIDDVPVLCDEQTGERIEDVAHLDIEVEPGMVRAEARLVLFRAIGPE